MMAGMIHFLYLRSKMRKEPSPPTEPKMLASFENAMSYTSSSCAMICCFGAVMFCS